MQLNRDSLVTRYLPVKAISASFSNKLAVTEFTRSIIIAICAKSKLKLYFVCIVVSSTI